jgi:hypothetical protein
MNVTRPDPGLPPGKPENLLRYWRDMRSVNPRDLSFEAGVSQRQISFMDSGRQRSGRCC